MFLHKKYVFPLIIIIQLQSFFNNIFLDTTMSSSNNNIQTQWPQT